MKTDRKMEFIRAADIERALNCEYRQYLSGRLQREQKHLKHIEEDIEVGISQYSEFTADKPHVHPVADEHGYVLQGAVKIICLDGESEETEFRAGDYFVVPHGIPYASKNAPGTKILFIKAPGINDKTLVDADEAICVWLARWE